MFLLLDCSLRAFCPGQHLSSSHGMDVVSIFVPLFVQRDGAWWLPLTGLSHGYPTHLVQIAHGFHHPFKHHSPSSSIVDEY